MSKCIFCGADLKGETICPKCRAENKPEKKKTKKSKEEDNHNGT